MATFGWEKALGDAGELSWWEARVAGAVTRQHIRIGCHPAAGSVAPDSSKAWMPRSRCSS
jgi:hypothetical protein